MRNTEKKTKQSLCGGYDYVRPETREIVQPMAIQKWVEKTWMQKLKNLFVSEQQKRRQEFIQTHPHRFNLQPGE